MHTGMRIRKILYAGFLIALLLSLGYLYREYVYVERMAKEYIEISFLYQSVESKTQVLKENIHHMISSDKITVKDIVYTSQAANSCYEAFVEARECANTYIEGQVSRPFPTNRIQYKGEDLVFDGLVDLYESSYNLEDALKKFENDLLKSMEDDMVLLEMKNTLPLAMEDVEWLERAIPKFAEFNGEVKAIIFNYFRFLKDIEMQSVDFLADF